MKAMVRAYSVLLLTAVLFGTRVLANDPLVEKKKTYSKSYAVSSSDMVQLSNQFGEMKISTWSKNEVKVDVTMTAEAGTDERAQQLLDAISVTDGKTGKGVYFKTKLNEQKGNQKRERGEKQSFSIDMVVFVPENVALDATNEFGPMSIGDYSGDASFTSKFGSFTAGKLNKARVQVEFGKTTVAGMTSGTLIVKFSRGLINNVSGDVKATFEHCSGIKLDVENNIKSLDIKNDFTNLYLDVQTGLSARFDIKTSFTEVKNKTSFSIKRDDEDEESHGPKFDYQYQGQAGSGSAVVKIKSNFQPVTIGHNLSFDMNKDDDDKKEKKRTRNI